MQIKAGGVYRSYTAFTSWLNCGKAWQLSRQIEVDEQPAWWFAGGKAVHTASEVYDHKRFEETGT